MRTVEEVRRLRLAQLNEAAGGWAAMNEALDLAARDSTLSQIANQSQGTKTKKPKTMGSLLARRIEVAFKKPVGWMDTDPDAWPFETVDQERFERLSERQKGRVEQAVADALALIESESEKQRGVGT